jgi:hypothetical protein
MTEGARTADFRGFEPWMGLANLLPARRAFCPALEVFFAARIVIAQPKIYIT